MVEVGRDLWRASVLIPLLKQGHFNPSAQGHVQMTFYYLQRGRLHYLSVHNLLLMLHQPQNEQVFSIVQREPPVLSSAPVTEQH